MGELIAGAKALHAEYGNKLSMFWGNPEFGWGRMPVIDRLDLLDHGVALLHGIKPSLAPAEQGRDSSGTTAKRRAKLET